MLKIRVIPTLLYNGVGLVKGQSFRSWRSVGTLLPAVRVFNSRDVDELTILDIAARREGRPCDDGMPSIAARASRVPLSIGGGVNSVHDVARLLELGADKVVLNSGAIDRPELIAEAAAHFGSQCVVVSVDAVRTQDGLRCAAANGTRIQEVSPADWGHHAEDLGAGEIVVTSVERDGTMTGYDLDLIASVASAVSVPVVASGGASTYEDFRLAVVEAGASAVAAGAMFQFSEATPHEAKKYLSSQGVPVRLESGSSSV